MTEFLQYGYVFLWGILAILMFITGFKQGPLAFVMSLFFVFMTIWYGLRAFGGIAVFDGVMNIVFRCVLGVFLALFIAVYFYVKNKRNKNSDDE